MQRKPLAARNRQGSAVLVPPRRRAHQVFSGGVGERLRGSRLAERPRSRHAPVGRANVRAGRCATVGRDVDGRPQDREHLRYAIVDEAMQREAATRLDTWAASFVPVRSTARVTALRRRRLRGLPESDIGSRPASPSQCCQSERSGRDPRYPRSRIWQVHRQSGDCRSNHRGTLSASSRVHATHPAKRSW